MLKLKKKALPSTPEKIYGLKLEEKLNLAISCYQGGRGHWTVNYASTQGIISTLSYSLAQKLWLFY